MSIPRKATRGAPSPSLEIAGLAARRIAADMVHGVIAEGRPLDAADLDAGNLANRDRAFARAIAAATLRRLGTLRRVLGGRMARGLPPRAGKLEAILLTGAAQLLLLDVPVHAAVDLAVHTARADRDARHFAPLVNAVLRGIAAAGIPADLESDPRSDTPPWLFERWASAYGAAEAEAFARLHRVEPALDLTARRDPGALAERLGALLLPTGSVRLLAHGPISDLPGYAEGDWWVQDAAAALPAKLLAPIRGKRIADLCAAPGGKTAQLAAAGAHVVAVDRSAARLERLTANLDRLQLLAETFAADVREFQSEPFDAVLLDAPCSATGTIRRHPDVAWLKESRNLASLSALQSDLLDAAVRLLRPGGRLVYSVCSLEPEEGEQQIERALGRHADLRLETLPGAPDLEEFRTPAGHLRTLPNHWPNENPRMAGLDGFFAARLVRI